MQSTSNTLNLLVRSEVIQSHIKALREAFGRDVEQHNLSRLRDLHDAKDYTGMVKLVRDSMGLKLRIRVGLVNKGGGWERPARVQFPDPMPLINSQAFNQLLITMYLRKSFLEANQFERTVMIIAHEMSHLVLEGLRHPLRTEEVAVDLTAMLLGYRDVYVEGGRYVEIGPSNFCRKASLGN
jgi:hypothetical protein